MNDPKLTLFESFNWNLFPATSPCGVDVVTDVIPVAEINAFELIFDDGLTTNPNCFSFPPLEILFFC